MGRGTTYTVEEKLRIVEQSHAAGRGGLTQVAKDEGIPVGTLSQWRRLESELKKKAGLDDSTIRAPRNKRKNRHLSPDEAEELVLWYNNQGASVGIDKVLSKLREKPHLQDFFVSETADAAEATACKKKAHSWFHGLVRRHRLKSKKGWHDAVEKDVVYNNRQNDEGEPCDLNKVSDHEMGDPIEANEAEESKNVSGECEVGEAAQQLVHLSQDVAGSLEEDIEAGDTMTAASLWEFSDQEALAEDLASKTERVKHLEEVNAQLIKENLELRVMLQKLRGQAVDEVFGTEGGVPVG